MDHGPQYGRTQAPAAGFQTRPGVRYDEDEGAKQAAGILLTSAKRDALAERVIKAVGSAFQKLADAKEDIAALRAQFKLARKEHFVILGCETWEQFCNAKLGRNIRTVQLLLSDKSENTSPSPEPASAITPATEASEPEPPAELLNNGGDAELAGRQKTLGDINGVLPMLSHAHLIAILKHAKELHAKQTATAKAAHA
jgi:hypothetical protein